MAADLQKARMLFLHAVGKLPPEEWDAYVAKACGGDDELLQQIGRLLEVHREAGSFLNVPAVGQVAADLPHPDRATVAMEANAEGAPIAAPRQDQPEQAVTQDGGQGDPEEIALGFLQPSDKPGSLGRLGHYEIQEVIGRGGFGIVLRAFDEMLHRVVAVKVMASHMAATSPARKRFLREARAAAAIRHENVVAIYAVEEQPIPYLVMEFIAGQTLQAKLDQTGPLGTAEVLRVGRQVAGGLAAAHARGLIHRDIKPANILLENGVEPQVKITDFGLARAADDATLTQSGVIAGTPMYMAPEQAQAGAIDYRADLFSLGSVLYTVCSGRPPFRAPTTLAVLKRVVEDTPRPIREIIPEVPEWLCQVVARLHAKDPAERFQSAREVADVLGRELAMMQRGGERPQTPPPAKRSRRQLVVAAAVLLLFAAGFVLTEAIGMTHVTAAGVLWLAFALSKPAGTGPAAPIPPPVDLFQDAVLHMTFAKDTFYEKEGKTYVRDLSGNGHDGRCEGDAPEVKAGGGLEFDGKGWLQIPHSLVNHQANYTITAWVRLQKNAPDGELFKECSSQNDLMIYDISLVPAGGFFCAAWNRSAKEKWFNCDRAGVLPYGKWVFLSIALENGGSETGSLRVSIDDKEYHLPSQMVDSPLEDVCVTLGRRLEGTLGEVAVFHRCLSAREIEAIRRGGGDPNVQSIRPAPPAADLFKEAALHMTFAKDTFYEKEGKTYVRDLSGNGYDGLCEGVAYAPEGKAGGGLKCDGKGWLLIPHSLLNHQANYTVAAWVRLRENAPDGGLLTESNSQEDKETIYVASVPPGGGFLCAVFNRNTTGNWFNCERASVFPYGKWVFLSIALENGGTQTGSLRVTMDDKEYHFPSQKVESPLEDVCVTLGRRLESTLGEVAVFHRCLSAREIEAIRQRGSDKAPPP
jgi:hypothetical protein